MFEGYSPNNNPSSNPLFNAPDKKQYEVKEVYTNFF